MWIDVVGALHSGVFLAAVFGVYGVLPGSMSAPFLVAGRFRGVFASVPGPSWGASYVLWIPLPAAVWGFVFGVAVSVIRDVRPADGSSVYSVGVDGIVVATVISVVLWPALLLYVLPARGVDWYGEDDGPATALLVVGATVWYLLFVVVAAYALVVLAGFGEAMSGT